LGKTKKDYIIVGAMALFIFFIAPLLASYLSDSLILRILIFAALTIWLIRLGKTNKDIPVVIIILFIIIPLLTFTLSNNFRIATIEVTLKSDGSISPFVLEKTYWGFRRDTYEIKYIPESREFVEGWYYLNNNETWVGPIPTDDSYYDDPYYYDNY